MRYIISNLLAVLLLSLPLAGFSGQWQLDPDNSSVTFVSIKNEAVAETHHFKRLQGQINAQGVASLAIDLSSVDTAIDIRDQRMRELLFQVTDFPQAEVSAQLDPQRLADLNSGQSQNLSLDFDLNLHGANSSSSVPVMLFLDAADCLHVVSLQPILVNAADYGLVAGIEALREIAGLGSIARAVPVSLHLQFHAQKP